MTPDERPSLVVSLTWQAWALLHRLHRSGFYGLTLEETAERLICQGLIEVMPLLADAEAPLKPPARREPSKPTPRAGKKRRAPARS